jgi:hypothetical protein
MNIIEGAKVLAELLEKRHGAPMGTRESAAVKTVGALPIIHWVGAAEPPIPGRAGDGEASPSGGDAAAG